MRYDIGNWSQISIKPDEGNICNGVVYQATEGDFFKFYVLAS